MASLPNLFGTQSELAISEDMRSKFLITRIADGSLQNIAWAIAKQVEGSRGQQHIVEIRRYTWRPDLNEFVSRGEWSHVGRNGKPLPVSAAKAVGKLGETELLLANAKLQDNENMTDAYELTDAMVSELQRITMNCQKHCSRPAAPRISRLLLGDNS